MLGIPAPIASSIEALIMSSSNQDSSEPYMAVALMSRQVPTNPLFVPGLYDAWNDKTSQVINEGYF